MLFQGAQATWWGYFAYGVSVYPGYELWKRVLFEMAGPMALYEYRVPLVLLAGAARDHRHVLPHHAVRGGAHPDGRRPRVCAVAARGGAPVLRRGRRRRAVRRAAPLLIRQVLFGMVKFLVFDSCADAIFASMPMEAQDDALITVGVSLLSGAIAGVASAIVSQPADVVLSAVAKGAEPGVEQGSLRGKVDQIALLTTTARGINRQYGFGGFYLGLGSRRACGPARSSPASSSCTTSSRRRSMYKPPTSPPSPSSRPTSSAPRSARLDLVFAYYSYDYSRAATRRVS